LTIPKKERVITYFSKVPKVNFFETEAKSKKGLPPMNSYSTARPLNWKTKKGINMQKFLPSRRISFIDEILSQKKLKIPGPGSYQTNIKPKRQANFCPKSTTPQLQMLDHSRWVGKQVPGPVYNLNYNAISPKEKTAKYYKPVAKTGIVALKKDTKPDMTTYKIEEPFYKTQTKNQMFAFSKLDKKSFFNDIVKAKKSNPDPGRYKPEGAYRMLSPPPSCIRRKR